MNRQNVASREEAIAVLLALEVPGSGPLELNRREAVGIIDALGLSWATRQDEIDEAIAAGRDPADD